MACLGDQYSLRVDRQNGLLAAERQGISHDADAAQYHFPVEAHLQFAGLDPLAAAIPS